MQIARTGVVAKPSPQVQHFIEGSIGEIGYRREPLHKTLKIGDNRCDLRLLQHHLGEPYFVRRFFNLPGQGFTPVFVVPVQHLG
ncbi:hypothetical protein D3C86_1783050 [compost metagenome]